MIDNTSSGVLTRGVVIFLTTVALLLSGFTSAKAEGELGLDVVVKTDSSNPTETNNFLWIASEAGQSKSRVLEIRSLSSANQEIFFEFYDERVVDGAAVMDDSPSEVARNFITFSAENFILGPGEVREVSVTFTPEAQNTSYFGFMRVFAGPAEELSVDDEVAGDANFRAVVGGLAAVRIPVWFGSGNTDGVITDFVIESVEGISKLDGNYLSFRVSNTGTTPITPKGSVELTDPDFPDFGFGPYEFLSARIDPGSTVELEVAVPDVPEQAWRIYIELSQGPVTKTKVFDIDLVFRSELMRLLLRTLPPIALIIAGAVGAALALRSRRKSKQKVGALSEERVELAKAPQALSISDNVSIEEKESALTRLRTVAKDAAASRERLKASRLTAKSSAENAPKVPTVKPKEKVKSEFDLELDSWAENLRSSIREVRADSTDLVEKYKDVPTRKPRKPKAKD